MKIIIIIINNSIAFLSLTSDLNGSVDLPAHPYIHLLSSIQNFVDGIVICSKSERLQGGMHVFYDLLQ